MNGDSTFFNEILIKNNLSAEINPTERYPTIYQVEKILNLLRANVLSYYKNDQIKLINIGFSIDTILISCYFNGIKCSSNDFNWFYSYDYGNCYTFNNPNNSLDIKSSARSGPSSGLKLEIFAGIPGNHDKFIEKRGFYVAVHNNSKRPLTKYEGFKVPVGYLSEVSVSRTFFWKLDAPYNNCRKNLNVFNSDTDIYKLTSNLTQYSRKLCFEICLQEKFIIKNCNCSDPSIFITNPDQLICDTLTELDCVNKIRGNFDESRITDKCSEFCPLECDSVIYSHKLGMADYPTDYYFSILEKQSNFFSKYNDSNQTLSKDLVRSTALMLNVYHEDTTYTDVAESATYTADTIFGIIGNFFLYFYCSRN